MKKASSWMGSDINRRFFLTALGSFATSVVVASCTTTQRESSANPASSGASPASLGTVKIGVWTFISEDILKFVKDNLAPAKGLDLEIVKFNDWVQPNTALRDGDIDANYFQHRPFMENAEKQLNLDLVMLSPGFLTPMGIYSKQFKSLDEVKPGSSIAIYSDASNGDRCLKVLAANGVIKLKPGFETQLATVKDIAENPKNLQFKELEGPAIVRSLDDVDLAVFSSGLKLQAKIDLEPLVQETEAQKIYGVGLVTLKEKGNDPRLQILSQLVRDPNVKTFIDEKYKGAVLAVF